MLNFILGLLLGIAACVACAVKRPAWWEKVLDPFVTGP